jgi:iron complex transport system ATP-binding protein
MIALEASGLTVRRGGRTILDDVSFAARAGDFVAVVGANGAGKSTLLSTLAGLLAPDAGTVSLNGAPIASLSGRDLARRRAYLPQNPRCEWPISVERLVALGLTPTLPAFGGLPPAEHDKIARVLEQCDLLDRREQPATTLSGGELARAMLARAFVGDPAVMIVDEPVTGLDPRHLIDAMERLRAAARDGKIVVASLHDLTVAGRYATHVVALREGRVLRAGPTRDILTTETIQAVFDVDAHVLETPSGPYVDYPGPGARRGA